MTFITFLAGGRPSRQALQVYTESPGNRSGHYGSVSWSRVLAFFLGFLAGAGATSSARKGIAAHSALE